MRLANVVSLTRWPPDSDVPAPEGGGDARSAPSGQVSLSGLSGHPNQPDHSLIEGVVWVGSTPVSMVS